MADESPPTNESKDENERSEQPGRGKKLAAGVAFGIGSAAIVAALLYSNRSKNKDSDS